jgi:ADP-ribose pyrophosphatase YjhB (NUDIX family)
MHKAFYASGFLYHPPTQQILLQQPDTTDVTLHTFGGKNTDEESAEDAFRRIISDKLGIDLPKKDIHLVYDYFNEELGEHYYLFYAETQKPTLDFKLDDNATVGWFPLKQLPRLKMTEQIRRDITVGQRVINLVEREKLDNTENAS